MGGAASLPVGQGRSASAQEEQPKEEREAKTKSLAASVVKKMRSFFFGEKGGTGKGDTGRGGAQYKEVALFFFKLQLYRSQYDWVVFLPEFLGISVTTSTAQ